MAKPNTTLRRIQHDRGMLERITLDVIRLVSANNISIHVIQARIHDAILAGRSFRIDGQGPKGAE